MTRQGTAYLADSLDVIRSVPAPSVNLVVTSPLFTLVFKKVYPVREQSEYVVWLCDYAREIRRVLREDGSFVIDIGPAWVKGYPTRSTY